MAVNQQASDTVDINQAKEGDVAAFKRLYARHAPRVYAVCRRLCVNPAVADEALQDTFLKIWQQLPQFRGNSQFSTWAHKIATYTAIDHWRKEPALAAAEEVQVVVSSGQALGQQRDLEQAIASLPKQARAVFVLVAVEGYTHAQVAQVLSIQVGTSKAQYFRARQLLKVWLEADTGTSGDKQASEAGYESY